MTGRWIRWTGLVVIGATIVFAVVLASRFGSDPALVESPLIGQPAPPFDLTTLDSSSSVSLADFEGKTVVVNFFASWCLECRAEHDALVATSQAFAGKHVQFIQIGYQESPDDSLNYLSEAGSSEFTLYVADPGSRTAISYGVFGIPETFFIDADGYVVGKTIGQTDALTLGATLDAIGRGERPGQAVTGSTQQAPEN